MDILIIDDERPARNRIRHLLEGATIGTYSTEEASSGAEAIAKLSAKDYDLVFLDIHLSDIDAFQLLDRFPDLTSTVVFVTAYDEHAVAAFEVEAVDYLLKPFTSARFYQALDRSMKKMAYDEVLQSQSFVDRIPIKLSNKYYFVETADIKYIKASGVYMEIFDKNNKKHICRTSMRDMHQKLDPANFFKINRSTIIHIQEIQAVTSEGGGDHVVAMHDGSQFSISRSVKREFFIRLNIR